MISCCDIVDHIRHHRWLALWLRIYGLHGRFVPVINIRDRGKRWLFLLYRFERLHIGRPHIFKRCLIYLWIYLENVVDWIKWWWWKCLLYALELKDLLAEETNIGPVLNSVLLVSIVTVDLLMRVLRSPEYQIVQFWREWEAWQSFIQMCTFNRKGEFLLLQIDLDIAWAKQFNRVQLSLSLVCDSDVRNEIIWLQHLSC